MKKSFIFHNSIVRLRSRIPMLSRRTVPISGVGRLPPLFQTGWKQGGGAIRLKKTRFEKIPQSKFGPVAQISYRDRRDGGGFGGILLIPPIVGKQHKLSRFEVDFGCGKRLTFSSISIHFPTILTFWECFIRMDVASSTLRKPHLIYAVFQLPSGAAHAKNRFCKNVIQFLCFCVTKGMWFLTIPWNIFVRFGNFGQPEPYLP